MRRGTPIGGASIEPPPLPVAIQRWCEDQLWRGRRAMARFVRSLPRTCSFRIGRRRYSIILHWGTVLRPWQVNRQERPYALSFGVSDPADYPVVYRKVWEWQWHALTDPGPRS
jgi:hypothetical protein